MPRNLSTIIAIAASTTALMATAVFTVAGVQLHLATEQHAITHQTAVAESRYAGAAAEFTAAHTVARGALKTEIAAAASTLNTAAGEVAVAGLEAAMGAAWAAYDGAGATPISSLHSAADALSIQAAATDTAVRELAAEKAKATATPLPAARVATSSAPPAVTAKQSTPATSRPPVVADFKTRAQTILNGFGGGAIIAVAPGALIPGAYGTCHAQTTRGLPTITIQTCPESFSERKLFDLLAHEDVHTITPPTVNFPLDQSVPGVPILEEIADCIAMGSPRFRTDPAPGGYMTSCSAGQSAASLAAIGRTS